LLLSDSGVPQFEQYFIIDYVKSWLMLWMM